MAYPACLLWYTVKDGLQPLLMTAMTWHLGTDTAFKQFLSCVHLMCSELYLLRPPPLPTFEYSDGHLVEIFPSASTHKVSQLRGSSNVYIGLTRVRWLFYNSEFCDINGEMACLKCFPMFFSLLTSVNSNSETGLPTKGFPHNYITGLLAVWTPHPAEDYFQMLQSEGFSPVRVLQQLKSDVCQKSEHASHWPLVSGSQSMSCG